MSPSGPREQGQRRGPGRPRDEHARSEVLHAALTLLAEDPATATIDAIARRAGVSRPLIYRWWPDRSAVVLEALLQATAAAAPYPDTGNLRTDLSRQMRDYVTVLTGPLGAAYRAMFADAQRNPRAAQDLRQQLIGPRRAATRQVLEAAVGDGTLKPGANLDVVIDQLYAPVLYRLLLGHAPLDDHLVDALIDQLFAGIGPSHPGTPSRTGTASSDQHEADPRPPSPLVRETQPSELRP